MNWRRALLFVPTLLIVAGFSAPAMAQSSPFFSPPTTYSPFDDGDFSDSSALGVTLKQNSAGGDVVKIYGANSVEKSYLHNLARSVGDALAIDRSKTDVTFPVEDDFEGTDTDVEVNLDVKLAQRQGSSWVFHVPTNQLLFTAQRYGYSELEVEICPVLDSVVDQSSRAPDNQSGHCKSWRQPVTTTAQLQAVDVKVLETPDEDKYWQLVGYLGVSVAIMTVISLVLALLLRRKWLKTLGIGNLIGAVTAVLGAAFMACVAVVTLAIARGPVEHFSLARNLDSTNYVLAIFLPGMLFAIPLTLAAIVLVLVPPPDRTAAAAKGSSPSFPSSAPGVPRWFTPTEQPAAQTWIAQPPQPGPQPQPQAPAPPPQMPPPQTPPPAPQPSQPDTPAPNNDDEREKHSSPPPAPSNPPWWQPPT